MKKHKVLIGLGVLVTLFFVGHVAGFYRLDFIKALDAKLYDYRLLLTLPHSTDDRIVILDIDEKSLKQEGRWPWGRNKLAALMDDLFDYYGVAAVGFDVVFAESDTSSGLDVLEALGRQQFKDLAPYHSALDQLRPQLEYDALFAEKLKGRKVVLGYYFSNSKAGEPASKSGMLPPPVFGAKTFDGRPIRFVQRDSYGANLPQLQAAAAAAGHFNPLVDFDGVVRRIPMLIEHEGAYYESLSLALVRAVLDWPRLVPGFANGKNEGYGGLEWLTLESEQGRLIIPVDAEVSTLVPYRGRSGTFKYLSVTDVLHHRIPLAALQNKIVLVGASAPGLMDMRSTPVGELYPGVEVHANMVSGILNQTLKHHPPYMVAANVALLLLLGLVLSLVLPTLTPLHGTLVALGTLVADGIFNRFLWESADLAMPLADSLLLITVLFGLNMTFGYFAESRAKKRITELFGQYVPSELVDEMAKHPDSVSMEGDSREMSILFADVRGFTAISERLDPKQLSLLMNEILTPLSRIIYEQRGTIDKYIGDAIMAFWGAPLPDTEHAQHAILAALKMQRALDELQPHFKSRGWPEIRIGIGINSGRVSVGNMGSEVRIAYTVVGDAVNLASRLEGITEQYGLGILVGEATKQAAPGFVYREVDRVKVKGKEQPVAIYEPLGLVGEVGQAVLDEVKLFHQALRSYRMLDWDKAEHDLRILRSMAPDCKLYQVYAERVAYYRASPPDENWDGVFIFNMKRVACNET